MGQCREKSEYFSIQSDDSGIMAHLQSLCLRERPCMLSWQCIASPFSSLIASSSALKQLTGVLTVLLCHPPCLRTKDWYILMDTNMTYTLILDVQTMLNFRMNLQKYLDSGGQVAPRLCHVSTGRVSQAEQSVLQQTRLF